MQVYQEDIDTLNTILTILAKGTFEVKGDSFEVIQKAIHEQRALSYRIKQHISSTTSVEHKDSTGQLEHLLDKTPSTSFSETTTRTKGKKK